MDVLLKKKNITKDNIINENKNNKIKIPLSGSLANVWTEFNIPDLTKKVPLILRVNVVIERIITQDLSKVLFSKTIKQCINVVKANQGIRDTFSTGSQNQKPPQPNS